MKKKEENKTQILPLILIIAIGLVVGSGIYTFYNAKGYSYLSDNPKACANCHVMHDVYSSWSKSGHHHVATCNACHLPSEFVSKWLTKAQNGFYHGYAFSLKELPLVLSATEQSKEIILQNCMNCHSNFVHNAINATAMKSSEPLNCVSCHKQVGHTHN